MNLLPSLSSSLISSSLSSRIAMPLSSSTFLLPWMNFYLHVFHTAWCCHCRVLFFRLRCSVNFCQTRHFAWRPENAFLVSSDHNLLPHLPPVFPSWLLTNWKCQIGRVLKSAQSILSPTWALDLCSSSRFTMGLKSDSLIFVFVVYSVSSAVQLLVDFLDKCFAFFCCFFDGLSELCN